MRFTVLATGYDGTCAVDVILDPGVRGALAELRERGVTVIIVTGRILDGLRQCVGDLRFVDAVVAENGAVIAFPEGGRAAEGGRGARGRRAAGRGRLHPRRRAADAAPARARRPPPYSARLRRRRPGGIAGGPRPQRPDRGRSQVGQIVGGRTARRAAHPAALLDLRHRPRRSDAAGSARRAPLPRRERGLDLSRLPHVSKWQYIRALLRGLADMRRVKGVPHGMLAAALRQMEGGVPLGAPARPPADAVVHAIQSRYELDEP